MRALALLLACGLCVLADGARAQTSTFKGLAAASRELSSRIAPSEAPLELERFMPAEDMEELLGTWSNYGSEHSLRNGAPNALNMVIWRVTLSRFADALGRSCAAPLVPLHPRFLETLRVLCAWPAPAARSEAVLAAFWFALMGYAAPEAEYAAWRDFFLRDYAARPAGETVAAMTLAITMNPYFLLHK